jgi:hypothetical protein
MSNDESGVGPNGSNIKGNRKTVIIIGDWFLDENWLIAKTESYSSSATGNQHYISKHDTIEKRIISLCGASAGLAVLKQYLPEFHFVGFGVWNRDDKDNIKCSLCNEWVGLKIITPYVLHPTLKPCEKKDKSQTLSSSSNESQNASCKYQDTDLINLANDDFKAATNRVIRFYEGYGLGNPNLLYRIDWVIPAKEDKINYNNLELNNMDVAAIVIQDHGRGVVNNSLIKKLIEIYDNKVTWYIRSKMDNPGWLKELKEKNIPARLNVVDYKLFDLWHGKRCSRYGSELGRASLETLGDLIGNYIYEHGKAIRSKKDYYSQRAAVLFDDNTAIAIDGEKFIVRGREKFRGACYNLYKNHDRPQQLINLGRTNMFFNALVYQDLSPKYSNLPFGRQCENALSVANEWIVKASDCWRKGLYYFYGDYSKAFGKSSEPEHSKKLISKELEPPPEDLLSKEKEEDLYNEAYEALWEKWNDSSNKLGIIDKGLEKPFQIWRGMGTLKDYICVGGPKRNAINDLLKKVEQFNRQKEINYSFNCLLVSSPGWGKSFLAKSLAKHFDMEYVPFSLSQMSSSNDVIDCFDAICSRQNISSKKRLLVFIDEINCEIEGHSALGLLLSPIWDGSFIRAGKKYKLQPAVWVFASTESTADLSDPKKNSKGSDFISRLNGPIIQLDKLATKSPKASLILSDELKKIRKKIAENPDISLNTNYKLDVKDHMLKEYRLKDFKGVFRTDQVYLGISLMNRLWGPVSMVQEQILEMFHDMMPINGFRSLEFFVSKFQNVQGGKVVNSNIPKIEDYQELKRHVILPPEWIGRAGEKMREATNDTKYISIEPEPIPKQT